MKAQQLFDILVFSTLPNVQGCAVRILARPLPLGPAKQIPYILPHPFQSVHVI